MIPNPSNLLLGNNGQPTLEQIQQRLAQQVQDNQNPNTGQQLIDLLQQSNAAMGMVPGAGAEADQTLQQLNPTGPQSMQNLQNMRQEIEQERATDEYPFYDEKELQANFERQKKAEDKQWQTFISSYKQEMKDKINQEHKDHVTFMTATGGTPLNLGEFAQQTGYLGGNKLQEAWEAHKENAGNVPPLNLYDDYNQTLLDSMEHRDDFDMERYTDLFHKIGEIQERISEHHAKGVEDLSQEDRYEVQNLMRSLSQHANAIDSLSGDSRNSRNKEAEIHTRNIFPNGFNPSVFKNAILASDPDDYFKQNFKLNAHDVQNVTAEHHLAEVHPDTFNRIKESNLPLGLKNSIINSNSLIPLYEQLADDIIEAHEAVDYTDTPYGIGNSRIHKQLKDKYRSLTLKDEIRQPTISFEKLLYNKFSQSSNQNVRHLKSTMTAFNRHYDDDDDFTGSLFDNGLGNGFDFDIFHHLEKVNKERATMNKMFKSPLDYVIDNLIAKAYLPTLRERGRDIEDQVALRWIPKKNIDTFNQAIPIGLGWKRGTQMKTGSSIHWEAERRQRILDALRNTPHPDEELRNIPGIYEGDAPADKPTNIDTPLTWVSPSSQKGIRPDVTFNRDTPAMLMAINQQPDWWRDVRQGADRAGAGEGIKYGSFDKDAFSEVPLDGTTVPSLLNYFSKLRSPMYNKDEVAEHFPNEHAFVQQFPNVDTRELWGEPDTLASTIEPINPKKVASEPMDIAMRLLKMPQEAKDYANQIHEGQMYGEQPYMNHVEDVASGFDDPHLQRIAYLHDTIEDSETGIGEIHERFGEDVGHAVDALTRRQGEQYFDYINRVKEHPEATQVKLADLHSNLKNNPNESLAKRYQKAIGILTNKSEPMDLAMDVLLKDRISPEAKRHKLEYDKKYESSPERVKYREELNRERRNRGIYGKHNHMDVSHTEGGKLTLESEHGNRARHFKEKGTLRHEE